MRERERSPVLVRRQGRLLFAAFEGQSIAFAESDAGPGLELEWRVSGGALERIADDVVLWTLPEDGGEATPFGQVAVWNDAGAVVENFVWSAA